MSNEIKTWEEAQVILNGWEAVYIDHATIVEFIRWIGTNSSKLDYIQPEKIASEYLGVDMAQLDKARKFLLEQERAAQALHKGSVMR